MLLSANLLVPKKMGTSTQFASLHFKPAHHHEYCLHVNCQAIAGTGWTGWLVNHHWPELCISLNVMWVQGLAEQPIHWSHRVNRALSNSSMRYQRRWVLTLTTLSWSPGFALRANAKFEQMNPAWVCVTEFCTHSIQQRASPVPITLGL